jgi:hypothetical protein
MREILKYYYIGILLMLFITVSCDKDKKETGPNTMFLLTNGTWVGSAAYENGTNKTEEFAAQNNDIRLLEVVFSTNGRVTSVYKQGRPETGTWKLVNNDGSILFLENTPNEVKGEILLLTENDFRVKDNVSGLELRFVKKQK